MRCLLCLSPYAIRLWLFLGFSLGCLAAQPTTNRMSTSIRAASSYKLQQFKGSVAMVGPLCSQKRFSKYRSVHFAPLFRCKSSNRQMDANVQRTHKVSLPYSSLLFMQPYRTRQETVYVDTHCKYISFLASSGALQRVVAVA